MTAPAKRLTAPTGRPVRADCNRNAGSHVSRAAARASTEAQHRQHDAPYTAPGGRTRR